MPHLRLTCAAVGLKKAALALVFGVVTTLSFAPANAWWLTPLCLAGVFLLCRDAGAVGAGALGVVFGIGWFATALWWILPGLHEFSDAGALWSFALTAALVLYLSLFPAAAAALCGAFRSHPNLRQSPVLRVFLIASVWTVGDWCRGNLFGGLPWLALGYSQTSSPLAGYGPLVGVYGLGFFTLLIGAAASQLSQLQIRRWQRLWWLAALALLLMGGICLKRVAWTQEMPGQPVVRLLQGNLPQQDKFSLQGLARAVSTYAALANSGDADLTVLPETALPLEWTSLPARVMAIWQSVADENQSVVLIGAVASTLHPETGELATTNSALAVRPTADPSSAVYRYDKSHLVPFGEFIPPGAQWLGKLLSLEYGAFLPGKGSQALLRVGTVAVAVGICFEDIFDVETADKVKNANLLVNMSNFAWFAHTYAPLQHLQAGQMRAIETGRWVVQAANTGATAVIDEHGVVQDILPLNAVGVLQAHVKTFSGQTPFMRMGNMPLLSMCLLVMVLAVATAWRRPGNSALD